MQVHLLAKASRVQPACVLCALQIRDSKVPLHSPLAGIVCKESKPLDEEAVSSVRCSMPCNVLSSFQNS